MAAAFATWETQLLLDNGCTIRLWVVSRNKNLTAEAVTYGGEDQAPQGTSALVLVHGGPGLVGHNEILKPFQDRFFEDSDVDHIVAYDQLGCGASEIPAQAELYTLDSHVEELVQVLKWTRSNVCQKLFVLGHSWGGQVVLEMLLRQIAVEGVEGAVISNSPLHEPSYQERQLAFRAAMDEGVRHVIEEDERNNHNLAYHTLIGASETNITGSMRDWSALNRLGNLAPGPRCLFVVAGLDAIESVEEVVTALQGHLPNVHVEVVQADHFPFYGPTAAAYFGIISNFITNPA